MGFMLDLIILLSNSTALLVLLMTRLEEYYRTKSSHCQSLSATNHRALLKLLNLGKLLSLLVYLAYLVLEAGLSGLTALSIITLDVGYWNFVLPFFVWFSHGEKAETLTNLEPRNLNSIRKIAIQEMHHLEVLADELRKIIKKHEEMIGKYKSDSRGSGTQALSLNNNSDLSAGLSSLLRRCEKEVPENDRLHANDTFRSGNYFIFAIQFEFSKIEGAAGRIQISLYALRYIEAKFVCARKNASFLQQFSIM